MSQQLKVGQVWKNRDGGRVSVVESLSLGESFSCFSNGPCGRYQVYKGGNYWLDCAPSSYDLIELIRDVPDSEGWITWNGGECPVPEGTLVAVRTASGLIGKGAEGTDFRWDKANLAGDIIAYRVVEPPAKSEQRATDSEGWITWNGGECPVSGDTRVEVKLHSQERYKCRAEGVHWGDMPEPLFRVAAYRVIAQPAESEQPAPNPKHTHYFKSVAHLETVDVYRVCELFGVTDQAIGHAIKKLLCAGQRGVKDQRKDVQEAIDTLTRRVAMWQEDEVAK